MRRPGSQSRRVLSFNGVALLGLSSLLGFALLAPGACSSDDGPTGFVIAVRKGSGQQPDVLRLDWLGADGYVFKNRRVPESGTLEPMDDLLATLGIDTNVFDRRPRRVLVRGYRGETLVGWASATDLEPELGRRKDVNVQLKDDELLDEDEDGVPDPIDSCLGLANPDQRPCPAAPDAAMPDAGPPDAAPPRDAAETLDAAETADVAPAVDLAVDQMTYPMGNLIVNPGFEDGVMGWDKILGEGGAATPAAMGAAALVETDVNGLWQQEFPVFKKDADYVLKFTGRSQLRRCRVGLQVFVMGQNSMMDVQITTTLFKDYLLEFKVPAGASTFRVLVANSGDSQCVVDDFDLRTAD